MGNDSIDDPKTIHGRVLYEDNHLIAVNKRVGEISQEDSSGDTTIGDLIKAYIKERDAKPGNVYLGVLHRLDRPVSGAILFARTSKAASRMSRLFRDGEIEKRYWAVVANRPPADAGTLVHYLKRDSSKNKSFIVDENHRTGTRAELSYELVTESDRYYLIEITMSTGRHHQIRAQLSTIGCPIKGDLKYGFPRSDRGGGIHLHARSLSFHHPVRGERITIIAPPPSDTLWDFFSARDR